MDNLSLGTINDDEFTEFDHDQREPAARTEIQPDGQIIAKRTRQKIPEKWTRVISINHDSLIDLNTFSIASDILMNQGIQNIIRGRNKDQWKPHFLPKQYKLQLPSLEI